MGLFTYSHLTRRRKPHFQNDRMVLLRFKLPLRTILAGHINKSLRLWNRHYFEHSLALTTMPLTFNIASLVTMNVFNFISYKTTQYPQHYTWSRFEALYDIYFKVTKEKNFFMENHLPLPIPLRQTMEDKKTRKRDSTESYNYEEADTRDNSGS